MTDTLVYLLDTNVLSEMMRSTLSGQVSDFLDRTRDEGHGISAVTVWEIEYGICRLDDGKRRLNLKCMFDSVLAELFKDRIFHGKIRMQRSVRKLWKTGAALGAPWTIIFQMPLSHRPPAPETLSL